MKNNMQKLRTIVEIFVTEKHSLVESKTKDRIKTNRRKLKKFKLKLQEFKIYN